MMKRISISLFLAVTLLVSGSWGACVSGNWNGSYCSGCSNSWGQSGCCSGGSNVNNCGVNFPCSQGPITSCQTSAGFYTAPNVYGACESVQNSYWRSYLKWTMRCDTQAEADSVMCELNPGMHWADGACSAPICETSCSSQKATCTDWKDSVTYTVDAGTGDTTFTCVGYCKTARMTHTDSTEAMDDSLSIIYRKNFADSVKVSYGENCVSPADTTGGGNPQEVGMTYFVSFNNVENELDTAGVSFIKGLYSQSCESTLYRGIKNGRYVFWYSPNDIPEGVTNVVRIR